MTALVGTGLATLAVSLTGVAGLSSDLHAAALKSQQHVPSLTPGEELHDTGRSAPAYVIRDACNKKHARQSKVGGTTPSATTPATTPTASSKEF